MDSVQESAGVESVAHIGAHLCRNGNQGVRWLNGVETTIRLDQSHHVEHSPA